MVAINANRSTFCSRKIIIIFLIPENLKLILIFIVLSQSHLKKSILFVINPISGGKNKNDFPNLVDKYLDTNIFQSNYILTEKVGHAGDITHEAVNKGIDIVVAVGGDGTINEIASALEGTNKVMGIIPCGSGNGLARSLGIPLSKKLAVIRLNQLNTDVIDSGTLNGRKFFNIAGMGFDAHISACFAENTTRGWQGYVKTTFSEISQYKSQQYRIQIDGVMYEREAFMVSIANSSQFGNNAYISPLASTKDGLLDVCIISPFPMSKIPLIGYQMFRKSTHKSKYIEIIRGKEIKIFRENAAAVHLDGEPLMMESEINIEIKPLSLSIIV